MCGWGRTSMPWSVRNAAGPIWSKKMNGPTICRLVEGRARRTVISPRATARGTVSVSIASVDVRSPSTGSGQGLQLIGRLRSRGDILVSVLSCLAAERYWDQARWAITAYAWRFDGLERAPRTGGAA